MTIQICFFVRKDPLVIISVSELSRELGVADQLATVKALYQLKMVLDSYKWD